MKEMNNLKLLFDGYAKWIDSGNCTFEQIKVNILIFYLNFIFLIINYVFLGEIEIIKIARRSC